MQGAFEGGDDRARLHCIAIGAVPGDLDRWVDDGEGMGRARLTGEDPGGPGAKGGAGPDRGIEQHRRDVAEGGGVLEQGGLYRGGDNRHRGVELGSHGLKPARSGP